MQKHGGQKAVTQPRAKSWNFTNGPEDKSRSSDLLVPIREKRRVIVKGLPKAIDRTTSDKELRELFDGFDVEAIAKIKWPTDGIHGAKSNIRFAFVDLKTAKEADRAVQCLDGMQRWGGALHVAVAHRMPGNKFERVVAEGLEREQEYEE